jgi:signal transduction histidine kinase
LRAGTAITREILAGDGAYPLDLIARSVREIAGALFTTVTVATADGEHVTIEVAAGADELVGTTYAIEGSLAGRAIATGRTVVHAGHLAAPPEWDRSPRFTRSIGSVIAVPLVGPDGVRGALSICRPAGGTDFVDLDVEMATLFADHASVALALADGREQRYRADVLEDHARLAGDLHDHVIQRLFAAALRLDLAAENIEESATQAEVTSVITSIRDTIGALRATVTDLRNEPVSVSGPTMRSRLNQVFDESAALLPQWPITRFIGAIDSVTDPALAEDVAAVVRELLSNAGRHAAASRVDVTVTTSDESVTVEVVDDGIGLGHPRRRSGLDSLTRRARRHAGWFRAADAHPGARRPGTRAIWTAQNVRT